MAMDADLLANLKSSNSDAFTVFEFDIGGTTLGYAPAWAALSNQMYEGRVLAAGSISREISDSGFSLGRDSASVTLEDVDRSLEAAIFAAGIQNITGTAARVKIVSPSLASSKWFTLYEGIIEDFSVPAIAQWQFQLRRNDYPLLGKVKIPYIQSYDWPNAHEDVLSAATPGQVVYGAHLSTGTEATGMVPTIYVDTASYQYYVSMGPLASVEAVYVDGVESASSNWTYELVRKNSVRYSVIQFTSEQNGGEAVVTVDCTGVFSGTTNPATQLEHFLANMVFGAWRGGELTVSNFPIDESYFDEAEAFLADKQLRGGRVITSEATGIGVLQEWCQQFQIPAFWTYGGDIAIRPDDHTETDIYNPDVFFRQDESPEPDFLEVAYNAREIRSEVRTQYLYDHAGGQFQRQLTVVNPNAPVDSPASLDLQWRESVL